MPRLFLKATLLTGAFLLILILLTTVGVGLYARQQLQVFGQAAGISPQELLQVAQTGWSTQPVQTNGQITFLILGTDELANRDHTSQLTDTILLASLNLTNGQVKMYSLPRDLWSDEYQTKINALYEYGKARYPATPEQFPREVLQQMTGVPIHHTLVMNLETLATLINLMGGIDVNVPESFIDTEFPRSDVDVTQVHDPALLYKTVTFQQGTEHMNGQRVLEFVRSRHSASEQGNDLARGQRQQAVILDVIETLKNPRFFTNAQRDGQLYRFYQQHFATALPIPQVIAIAKKLLPLRNQITFQAAGSSIYPDDANGVIFHPTPTAKYQNQWVYSVRNQEAFQQEVQTRLLKN